MTVGLFQDPRSAGIFYAIAETGRKIMYETRGSRVRLALAFGYDGPGDDQAVTEWLSEKATVLLPPQAELEIEVSAEYEMP